MIFIFLIKRKGGKALQWLNSDSQFLRGITIVVFIIQVSSTCYIYLLKPDNATQATNDKNRNYKAMTIDEELHIIGIYREMRSTYTYGLHNAEFLLLVSGNRLLLIKYLCVESAIRLGSRMDV